MSRARIEGFAVACAVAAALGGCDKLQALLRDEPSRAEQEAALTEQGRAALAKGDLDAARRLYEGAAGFSPTSVEPQQALGRIYAELGNDGQALLALKRAVELRPGDVPTRVLLSELYLRRGKPEAAVEELKRAIEASPGAPAPDLARRLGAALLKSGELDEAEAVVARLNQSAPRDAETLALLAEVLIAKRREEKGLQLLDAAVAAAPDSVRVRAVRARYFASRGKVEQALREYEVAVRAAPDDVELALGRARALAAARRMGEATAQMEQVVRRRPQDLEALAALAEMQQLAGDLKGAEQTARQVLARNPRSARALFVRAGVIEAQSGDDPVRAINAYREVLDVDPGQAESLSRLWRLYLKHGEKTEAMSALEHLRQRGEIAPDEEIELAALYAETGLSVGSGLEIIDAALRREPGNARCLSIRQALSRKAAPRGR